MMILLISALERNRVTLWDLLVISVVPIGHIAHDSFDGTTSKLEEQGQVNRLEFF